MKDSDIKPPTIRWTPLRYHPEQHRYWTHPSRFKTVPAGRRSGKTELAKRKVVYRALQCIKYGNKPFHNARFAVSAPVYAQAKKIYWDDLQALIPRRYIEKIKESELYIKLINNVEIHVIGMDKPARIEGQPWDGVIVDEIADMKPQAFSSHIRPALADRCGWCDLIGVPEGRNHYYDLVQKAIADTTGEWSNHSWISADILDPSEIRSARMLLDEVTFNIEYNASFDVNVGLAYYAYNPVDHCRPLQYNPNEPLILCFDFNVDPGIAAILQEQVLPGAFEYLPNPDIFGTGTLAMQKAIKSTLPDALIRVPVKGSGVIDEVWIDHNSNTAKVCHAILEKFQYHQGLVLCYGDATGGAKGTAKLDGSDWDIINKILTPVFRDRLRIMVGNSNPSTRARKNAMNARLKTVDGTIRMMVDKEACPRFALDLEGTMLKTDGSGDIDKVSTPKLTHMCFSGDTKVRTNKGVQAIKSIDKNGFIYTPYGMKRFSNGGLIRGRKPTIYVYLDNGTFIDCTKDHLILTLDGWVEARKVDGRLCYTGNNVFLKSRHNSIGCRNELSSLVKGLSRSKFSRASVIDSEVVQDVYCPSVEVGCFYLDNGVLVGNSDAVGYYVASQFPLHSNVLSGISVRGRY